MVRTPGLADVGGETGVTDPVHPPLDMAPIVAVAAGRWGARWAAGAFLRACSCNHRHSGASLSYWSVT
jgi:hypothetical protein